MNLWTYNLREIQRRPGRMLLTLLGIIVGLATVVATRLTIHTVDRAYHELFEGVSGRSSLEVTAKAQGGFDPGLARGLESIRGVKAVVPRVQSAAALTSPAGSVAVPVMGIPPDSAAADDWTLREGHGIGGDDDALIDPGLADSVQLRPGQVIELWTSAGASRFVLSGIFKPRSASAATGGQLVVSLSCAQRLFALPQQVNSIQVLLTDEADPQIVQSLIARRLPAGLVVQPPGMRGAMARATLLAAEQGLSALSIVALIAAAFVILNTFLLNLGERRKQIAVLRSLGASRAQVMRLLLRETAVLGLAGTAGGCTVGVALALGLNYAMQQFLGLALPRLQWGVEPFLLAALLGPVTSIVARCLPAWRASRRPPLAELLPGHAQGEELLPRGVCRVGLFLLAAGLGLEISLWHGHSSQSAGRTLLVPTLALLLVGCVLALPLVLEPMLTLAGALPLGLEGRLAVQQLARHPGRTSLTIGVLFLALVVAIAFGQSLRTTLRDLRNWYRQTIVADFLVRGAMPDASFVLAPALPETLGEEISGCDDAAVVDHIAFVPAEIENQPVLVLARTFAGDQPLPLNLQTGDENTVRARLSAGEAVLGTGLAQRLGLHPGDAFKLTTRDGVREVRIAATAVEYAGGGLALYLEWNTARRLLDVPGAHVFLVSSKAGRTSSLGVALRGFCERHHLMLQSNADLRDLIDSMVGRVTGVLWGLMALAFAVASLGIVNTLTMNVHDQTREFGLLRALGLKRHQVGRIVLTQAALLAGISLLPGSLVGVGLAYAIHRSSASWAGPQAAFQIDGLLVLGCCVLAVVMAVLAAGLPARRAVRLLVAQALHHA
jgi:putative ABC transport system permease protein